MCTVNVHVQCARRRRNAPVTWSERGIYAMLGMWRDGARRAAVLRGMRGAHTAAAATVATAAGTPAATAVPASAAVESAVLAATATASTATAAGAIHATGAAAAAVSHDAAFGIRWTRLSLWLGRPEPRGDFCCAARSGRGDCIHSRDASAGAGAFQLIGIRNAERRHGLWRIRLWRIGHRRIG